MTWPQGMEPLRWMSRCIGLMVALVFCVVAVCSLASMFVGPQLDCWLAPNRTWPGRSCDELWSVNPIKPLEYLDGRFYYVERNNLTLDYDYAPSSCQSIHNTDVVSNETEAQECTAWCEERLGRGAGAPIYIFVIVVAFVRYEAANIIKSCWKANLAAVADSYIPNPWLVGVLYRFFGLLPAAIVLWRGCHQARQNEDEAPPDVIPPDRLCCRDDGPFRHGKLGFPWCCRRASNDLCASRWKLRISGLGILTEPLFDAITVTACLKNGQPFYFVFMLLGLYNSFSSSGWDGLQAQGALAFVPSWQRGFATKEMLEQRNHDLWECSFSTCIQLYAALTLSWKESPFEILQFGAFGCMSLVLSLPEAVPPRPKNFDNFYEVEDAKKNHIHRILKYIPSVMVVFLAQSIQNFVYSWKRDGLDWCFVCAWLPETVLLVYWFPSLFVLANWFIGMLSTGFLASHVRSFMASWESFRDFPWTLPLSLTWHHSQVPEARWDLMEFMAAAMQVVFPIVGILSADIMGYREYTLFLHLALGYIAICAVLLGHYWAYYDIIRNNASIIKSVFTFQNTEDENYEPLVENHQRDLVVVELEAKPALDEEPGPPGRATALLCC